MEQILTETVDKPKQLSLSGKILIAATGGIGIAISLVSASFVAPAFRKIVLPYVPATPNQIKNVFSCLPSDAKKLLDIGSGDGRIVTAMAKSKPNLQADGVELNIFLVLFSRFSALKHNVQKRTRFYRQDLWNFSLKPYDTIVVFGVEQMMKDLEQKLLKESPNARVIACRFKMPNLEPIQIINDDVDTVWFYDLSKLENPLANLK